MITPIRSNRSSEDKLQDERLLRAVLEGEPGAFKKFYCRWMSTIRKSVQRTLRRAGVSQWTELEDATQEVWAHLTTRDYRVLRRYRPQLGSLGAYLTRVAQNKILEQARRTRFVMSKTAPLDAELDTAAEEAGFDVRLEERQELVQRLDQLAAELPPKGQATLLHVYVLGQEPAEAAQNTKMTVRAVYNWCHKIRAAGRRDKAPPVRAVRKSWLKNRHKKLG